MPISLNRSLWPRLLGAAAIAALCALMGWSLAQHSKLELLPVAVGAAIALMLVFAEVGLTALWLWPALGVLAFPLATHLPGGKYVTFDRVWVGGMAVLLLTQPKVRTRVRASKRLSLALGLLTVVLGARAIVTPADSLFPIRTWFDSLVVPVILFGVVRRAVGNDGELTDRIAFALTIAGLLLAVIGIGEHLIGFELATSSGSQVRFDSAIGVVRISGPYDAPETYGLTLVICLGATMYWLLSRSRTPTSRNLGIGIVCLELVAVFFTYFRVGWISALIVVLAALGLRPKRYGRAIATVLLAALVVVPVFLQLTKISAVSQRVNNTDNIYVRLATYEQGWEIFKTAPWFGVGAQDYTNHALALPTKFVHGAPNEPYPHSSLFEVMAEDGVVGLSVLVFAFIAVCRLVRAMNRTVRTERDEILAAVVAGAGISYLIYSLSLTMLPYSPSNEMFAILLGMAAGRLDFLAGTKKKVAAATRRR